jgi:predicted enzyme related to lactoylglutathione lyase
MPHNVVHFAVQADDVERARRFYEAVFGWRFEPWGPPDFYRIRTGDEAHPGIEGALYQRHEPNPGTGMRGFRCTIAVDDIDKARAAVLAQGCKLTSEKSTIVGVGALIEFLDPEGNLVCAMQYEVPRY